MKLFSYTLFLLHYDGIKERGGSIHAYSKDLRNKYGKSFADGYKEVVEINQAALFSGRETSTEDHQLMISFKDLTLKKVITSRSIFQRIKMKLWEFIY